MHAATDRAPYAPLSPQALPQEMIAHALHWGIGDLDGAQLRRLDQIALITVQALPRDLSPTDRIVDNRMHDLRLRIAAEQTRRAQQWARITAQLAGMDTDPDTDPDQNAPPQETDADRAAQLLRAALMLIMGTDSGSHGNGGGGRPVRPIRPGPTTPPVDGRALSLPGQPPTARRGDDDIPF